MLEKLLYWRNMYKKLFRDIDGFLYEYIDYF